MLRSILIFSVAAIVSAAIPTLLRPEGGWFFDAGPTSRPAAELAMAAKPDRTVEDEPHGRAVRIAADTSGHFRAGFRINGVRVEGMIDTGATLVALNRSAARRVGLKLDASDFRHEVSTANGMARAASATIDRIEIGRVTVRDVPAMVLEDKALSTTLVGMSFLKALRRFEAGEDGLLLVQ